MGSPVLGRAVLAWGVLLTFACGGEDVTLGDGRSPAAERSFSPPVLLDTVSTDDSVDDDPSLTGDLRTLYFNSKRAGGVGKEDIWRTHRDSIAEPWSPPELAPGLNTDARETGLALSADGLSLWFSSDREGTEGLDVFVTHRTSRSAAWAEPERVLELTSSGDDLVSAIHEAGRLLLLARRSDGDADYDLFAARRPSGSATWETPRAVASLNTDEAETDAFLASGGSELWFTRARDLYVAPLRDAEAFDSAAPVPLDALNSAQDDRDAWVAEQRRYVVFSSDRGGAYRLYESWW